MPDYPPGMPSWVDLVSPDREASLRFYAGVFGWRAGRAAGEACTLLTLDGRAVAGLSAPRGGRQTPAWFPCVTVLDADAAAARAEAAGGEVLAGPLDVPDAGRLAVVADPTGAAIACWQPAGLRGADLVNRAGSFCWSELATRDTAAAAAFYHAVFDWHAATDRQLQYTEWKLVDRTIGGMVPMGDDWPAEVPAHWMVYFAVEDCDAAAARATELGGTVHVEPSAIAPGRHSVLADPHGAVFAVIELNGA